MAAIYADLGQRIAGSAMNLASSTFSGVSGFDAEAQARRSLVPGKSSAGSAPSAQRGLVPTDFSRHVAISESSDQAFRSSSGWAKDVEQEYQDFSSGPSTSLRTGMDVADWIPPLESGQVRSGWETLWAHKRIADLPSSQQSIVAESDVQPDGTTPLWERSSRGEVVYQEDGRPEWKWRHEWKRINKHISRQSSKQDLRPANEATFELDLATRMDGIEMERYNLQSSALARLQLLKQHLTSTKPESDHMQSWKPDWEMQQHERCDWTVDREDDNQPPNEAEPENAPERYYFHCPYRDCHHRLLRQNENLTLDIRQRACVHQGCGYVSDTVESWLKHVTSSHHGLPGVQKDGTHDDRSSCGCASSDKSALLLAHDETCTGGVWLMQSKNKSKLDVRIEPCRDAPVLYDQPKTYERWSTEMKLDGWDSSS